MTILVPRSKQLPEGFALKAVAATGAVVSGIASLILVARRGR